MSYIFRQEFLRDYWNNIQRLFYFCFIYVSCYLGNPYLILGYPVGLFYLMCEHSLCLEQLSYTALQSIVDYLDVSVTMHSSVCFFPFSLFGICTYSSYRVISDLFHDISHSFDGLSLEYIALSGFFLFFSFFVSLFLIFINLIISISVLGFLVPTQFCTVFCCFEQQNISFFCLYAVNIIFLCIGFISLQFHHLVIQDSFGECYY